ncbi:MAG: ABC transporter permease [Candidatus Aminicenantaceae bacterium]
MKRTSPSKFAERILSILSSSKKTGILGDTEEEYRMILSERGRFKADIWYTWQIFQPLPFLIRSTIYWNLAMFKNYIKIALRNIKRHKGYSLINIIGLVIGITCCLYIFLYVQHEFSYDRYHNDADRIYRIACTWKGEAFEESIPLISFPVADVVKERYNEIESIGRLGKKHRVLVRYGDKAFYENGLIAAEPEIFDIFHIPLLKGGPVLELARSNTIILTEQMAEKYIDSEDLLGKSIQINNTDFEIIGIAQNAPVNSHLHYDFIASLKKFYTEDEERSWTISRVYTYVKLMPGADVDAFGSKIRNISDSFLGKNFPFQRSHYLQRVTGIHLNSRLQHELKPPGNKSYILIFSAVGLLTLLIACLNFINLATAKSIHRSREVGMRKVIGAQRSQIIRQFLLESSIIALGAVVLSVGLTYLSMPYFKKAFGMEILFVGVFQPMMFLMLLACTLLIGVGVGCYPAFFLSRFNPVSILQGTKGGGRNRSLMRQILVILQFAISVGLIICTLVMYSQIDYMKNASLGFEKEEKLIISAIGAGLKEKKSVVKSEFLLSSLVRGVTVSSSVPGGKIENWGVHKLELTEEYAVEMKHLVVDEDFLPEYGIELIAGRNFQGYHGATDAQACILNEAAVKHFGWALPEEALGQKLVVGPEDNVDSIIGVTRDFHFQGLQTVIGPMVFEFAVPSQWSPLEMITLNVNTIDLREILSFAKGTWNKLFPGQPFEYFFLDEDFNRLYMTEETRSRIFGLFALLGLSVACMGLLGLVSFAAEQKTKEIGIRKVLGASVSGIVLMLSREFTKCVVIANTIAWPIAYFVLTQWLQNFAYRTPIGLWIFILSSLLALFLALATVSFHAIKVATLNPVDSLRYE